MRRLGPLAVHRLVLKEDPVLPTLRKLTAGPGTGPGHDHWDGVLYPPGTPPRDRLAHYVRWFGTVELNASFYRWPRDASFASWRRRLPPGFQLSVKAPRGLTHAKRLYAPEPRSRG